MFEKIITDALNQHLGAFIENIDTAQLGASIYKGSLLLKNMRLKPSLFDNSPVPFQLVHGQIGKIYLKIPFWNMFSSPLIIEIENVIGVVKVKPMENWDEQQQRESYIEAQQYLLEQFEIYVRQMKAIEETEQKTTETSFAQKLVDRIFNNLKICIKNIYFRFEDKVMVTPDVNQTNSHSNFALGLKLEEFSIFTCDQEFNQVESFDTVRQEGDEAFLTYKQVVIKGFSFFCDWHEVDLPENGGIDFEKMAKEQEELLNKNEEGKYFMEVIEREFSGNPHMLTCHKNIIDNFNVQVKLQLNKDIQDLSQPATLKYPYISAVITIGDQSKRKQDSMTFSIYQPQIIRILKTLEIIGFFNEFNEIALSQFVYAKLTDQQVDKYSQLYQEWYLVNLDKQGEAQAAQLRKEMYDIEKLVDCEKEIVDIREVMLKKIAIQQGKKKEVEQIEKEIQAQLHEQIGYGWFMATAEKQDIESTIRAKFVDNLKLIENKYKEQEEKQCDSLKNLIAEHRREKEKKEESPSFNYQQNQLPNDYILFDVHAKIHCINFTIDNEFDQRIMVMTLDEMDFSSQLTNESIKAEVSLQDFQIQDCWSQSSKFSNLAWLKSDEGDSIAANKAISLIYEANNEFELCPFHLDAKFSKSLQIVCIVPFITELDRTFSDAFNNQQLDFKFYKKAATKRIKELREQAEVTAKELMDQATSPHKQQNHVNVSLNLFLSAPVIIIPENVFEEDSFHLEVSLGNVKIKSHLVKFNPMINYKYVLDENVLYDVYQIDLNGISFKIKDPKLQECKYMIKEISSQINIYNCLDHFHPFFPSVKVDQNFSHGIEFEIDLQHISKFFSLQDSITMQLENNEWAHLLNKLKKQQISQKKAEEIKRQSLKMQQLQADQKNRVMHMRKRSVQVMEQSKQLQTSHTQSFEQVNRSRQGAQKTVQFEKSQGAESSENSDDSQFESFEENLDYQVNLTCNNEEEDMHKNLSVINSSNTRIKRINTITYGQKSKRFDLGPSEQIKTDIDVEYNFDIKLLQVKVENNGAGKQNPMLLLQMKKFSTQVIMEHNLQDTAIDINLQTLQMKEVTPKEKKDLDFEEKDDPFELFHKIISSPINDYIKTMRRSQAEVNEELQNSQQSKMEKLLKDQIKKEQQLQVQIFIKSILKFDSSTQMMVQQQEIDVACVVNHTRIIYNIPTVMNILRMQRELDVIFASLNKNNQRFIVRNKMLVLNALQGKLQTQTEIYYTRIFRNMALKLGYSQNSERFLTDASFLCANLGLQFCETLQLQKMKNEQKRADDPYQQHLKQFENISEGEIQRTIRAFQDVFDKMFKKLKQIGVSNQVIEYGMKKGESHLNLGQIEDIGLPKLYPIKIEPLEYTLEVKVKVKNTELWLTDFAQDKINPESKAQILKLEFMTDLFMESETISKYITNSKKLPPRNILNDNIISFDKAQQPPIRKVSMDEKESESEEQQEDEDDNYDDPGNLVYETKISSSKASNRINITHLMAQQFIVGQWKMVQTVILNNFDEQYRAQFKKQFESSDSDASHSDASDNGSENYMSCEELQIQLQGSERQRTSVNIESSFYESRRKSSPQIDPSKVLFNNSIILEPACISILLVSNLQTSKISFSNMNIDVETLFLQLDFKDIELLNELMIRSTIEFELLYPEMKADQQEKSQSASIQQKRESLHKNPDKDPFADQSDQVKTEISNMCIRVKSIVLSLNDGDFEHFIGKSSTIPVPLLELCLSEIDLDMKSCIYVEKKNQNQFMAMLIEDFIERYTKMRVFYPPFNSINLKIQIYATYYNQMSQAFEPFIEPWSLDIEISQKSDHDIQEFKIYSKDFLNFNISYGMAFNLMEVKTKVLTKLEKQEKMRTTGTTRQEGTKLPKQNTKHNQLYKFGVDKEVEDKVEDDNINLMAQRNDSIGRAGFKFYNYTGTYIKLAISDDDLNEEMRLKTRLNNKELGNSNAEIFQDFEEEKVIEIRGDSINQKGKEQMVFMDFQVLEDQMKAIQLKKQKSSKLGGQQDFIEEEPMTIDLKISGTSKLHQIQIERVGVYSYIVDGICQEQQRISRFDINKSLESSIEHNDSAIVQIQRPVGLIVNVKSQGRQKIVSFESQLLLANNLKYPINLVFQIKQINQHSQEVLDKITAGQFKQYENMNMHMSYKKTSKMTVEDEQGDEADLADHQNVQELDSHPLQKEVEVELNPNDSFIVPLIWLMQDSRIDLHIKVEKVDANEMVQQDTLQIYSDIQWIFNQCDGDDDIGEDVQSKVIEINDDFYASIDIQAYKCRSFSQLESSPLQYVMSFNPPLMLSNLTFSPLELFEIDNPGTAQQEMKSQAMIPPKMSEYILCLDMSQDNKSWIKFTLTDNTNNQMLSCTIDKFFKTDISKIDEAAMKSQKKALINQKGDQIIEELDRPNVKSVKFYRHSTLEEYYYGKTIEGKPLDVIHLNMETVRKIYTDLKSYHENFQFRERVFDRSNAVKIMLYPRFMIVNKTNYDIIIHKQVVKSKQNDFLLMDLSNQRDDKGNKTYKISIKVEGFEQSKMIDLEQIGMSGVVNLKNTDRNGLKTLQFGIAMDFGPVPFNKTTILTIVPRYAIINKLPYPILIRQACGPEPRKSSNERQQYQYKKVNCLEGLNKENFHLSSKWTKVAHKTIDNRISYKIITEQEYRSKKYVDEIDGDPDDEKYWCQPFQVDDLDDFQTETKVKGKEAKDSKKLSKLTDIYRRDSTKNWFEPQACNQWNLFSRIIVTMNPADNNSTILIIFDEPQYEEYMIMNATQCDISFSKYDYVAKKVLSEPYTLLHNHQIPFVWNFRDKVKRLQLFIEGQPIVVQIDECTDTNQHQKIHKAKESKFFLQVRLSTEGTKQVIILEESKNELKEVENQNLLQINKLAKDKKEGFKMEIGFKGIGVSFIDNKPQELLYICIDEIDVLYKSVTSTLKDYKDILQNKQEFMMDIGNFQIDNLINEEMPVLLGAKNYYDKNIYIIGHPQGGEVPNLAHCYRSVKKSDMKAVERDEEGNELDRLPFLRFNFLMNTKQQKNKIGHITRYESIYFGVQEFFIQVETTILNDNIRFVLEVMNVFGKEEDGEELASDENLYISHLNIPRELTCPMLDASKGIEFDESQLKFDKISFGIIMLGTIKTNLTFKLQKRAFDFDFSNPHSVGGNLSQLNPFITNFAQISDANLQLNELIIIEGFYPQETLLQNLQSHYTIQGTKEVIKILGSSDLLGNPVGLLNKIGVGFVELRREPTVGMRQGTAGFLMGLGKGIGSVVKGVVGGTFESVSSFTGTLYSIIKESTGSHDTRDARVQNIGDGLVDSVKGLSQEIFHGVGGVFTKPYEGARQEGIKGFSKGVGKGLIGLMVTPLTASLRVGQSVSLGISGTANDIGNIGKTKMELMDPKKVRVRPPRRIDVRNQIKIFDEDISIVNKFLQTVSNGIFSNEQIRFYSVLPTINDKGVIQNKKRLVIVTNQYFIVFKIYNFMDIIKPKNLQRTFILSEFLCNIVSFEVNVLENKEAKDAENDALTTQDGSQVKYFFILEFAKKRNNRISTILNQNLLRSTFRFTHKQSHEESDSQSSVNFDSDEDGKMPFPDIENQMSKVSEDQAPKISLNEQLLVQQAQQEENKDLNKTYEFVIYSPSYEICKRLYNVLSSLPEIQQNLDSYTEM